MLVTVRQKTKDVLGMSIRDGLPWILAVVVVVLGVQWLVGYPIKSYVTNLMNIVWMLVMLFVMIKVLRYFSRQLDIVDFSEEVFVSIKTNPIALAIFFGQMFIGVALLASNGLG